MKNLLQETIDALNKYGQSPKDVKWVGTPAWGWFTWEDFERIADIEYDDEKCFPAVAIDLMVVGEDWWLERIYNYTLQVEWWVYKTYPKKPQVYKVPKYLTSGQAGKEGDLFLHQINE